MMVLRLLIGTSPWLRPFYRFAACTGKRQVAESSVGGQHRVARQSSERAALAAAPGGAVLMATASNGATAGALDALKSKGKSSALRTALTQGVQSAFAR
jgi:hypothetical protein